MLSMLPCCPLNAPLIKGLSSRAATRKSVFIVQVSKVEHPTAPLTIQVNAAIKLEKAWTLLPESVCEVVFCLAAALTVIEPRL